MLFYLPPGVEYFPHPFYADDDGLLAVGGSLTPGSILSAYRAGIFPWYAEHLPLCWWFTHPRLILRPTDLHISRSMRNVLKRGDFHCSFDEAFHEVIHRCREISRHGQEKTWITQDLIDVFLALHDMGYAHSVEVWQGKHLAGGLYGLAIGKFFYGESMFSNVSNASKTGFIHLVQFLKEEGFKLIDCQQDTPHLRSLGATTISGEMFLKYLRKNIFEEDNPSTWRNK